MAYCFPTAASLLCLWHANKAVLRYCLPSFTRNAEDAQGLEQWKEFFKSWHELVASTNERTFNERPQKLKESYISTYVREVSYIMETWLDLYKEKLVKAWVDQYPHFGNVVTSRGEGIHELIKIHLKASQLDLLEAWRAIKLALLNQLAELQANQAKQQIRTPIELSGSLYGNIRGWVSHEALRKVEEQRKRLLQDELPSCTRVFTTSLGLPCAHTLKTLLQQDQPLQLHHFHAHWHLQREEAPQLLLEPRQRVDRITINSTLPKTSTQRKPCVFEAVEAAAQPKAQPRCSRCHIIGHKMNSKACPLRYKELIQLLAAAIATETPATAAPEIESPALRYDDPQAIYQRYIAARDIWYKAQPRGSIKTNQQYRKALGLPLRYSKADYQWCLDWKQMGKQCRMQTGSRDWLKEEKMAYLDWDKSEQDRIEGRVAAEMEGNHFSSRRGMHEIWEAAAEDGEEQQAFYSGR